MGVVVAISTRISMGVVVAISAHIYGGSSSSSHECAYLWGQL